MRIITLTCPDCGTVVAGNVLETSRIMKCPGFECDTELRFEDLPKEAQAHLVENRERYTMDS
jgi:hypothetical protein